MKAWLAEHGLSRSDPWFEGLTEFTDGWEATEADRRLAWQVYVALESRLCEEMRGRSAGEELDALDALFDETRTLLVQADPDAGVIGEVVLRVLNDHVRRCTVRWRPRLLRERLLNQDARDAFQRELDEVHRALRMLTWTLAAVVRPDAVPPVPDPIVRPPVVRPAPMPWDPRWDFAAEELADLRHRREAWELPAPRRPLGDTVDGDPAAIGLALSGGGIRSATVAFGVLQALSKHGAFRWFDYLSTVSGGGYLGTLVSAWCTGQAALGEAWHRDLRDGPLMASPGAQPAALPWLRARSAYLTQIRPLSAVSLMALGAIGGLLSVLWLSGAFAALTLVLHAQVAEEVIAERGSTWIGPETAHIGAMLAAAVALGLFALAIAIQLRWAVDRVADVVGRAMVAVFGLVALQVAVSALYFAVAEAHPRMSWLAERTMAADAEAAAAMAVLVGSCGMAVRFRPAWLGRLLLAVSPFLVEVVLVTGWLALARHHGGHTEMMQAPTWLWNALFPGPLLVVIGAAVLLDVNEASPGGFYRYRLGQTWNVRPKDASGALTQASWTMDQLTPLAPLHLLNFALNLPAAQDEEVRRKLHGRAADFFVVSRHGTSSPTVPATSWEEQPSLPLTTAMGISGAAVSPQLGTTVVPGLAPWLAVLNIRMGYWLPHPRTRMPSLAGGWYLLREITGRVHERGLRLKVSDGGHIENLGILELLRRECAYIVAVDGEADGDLEMPSLVQLIRYARIELGAEIDIDVSAIRPDASGMSRRHVAIGRIRYRSRRSGRLLYIKSSVTGDEPLDVLAYRRGSPTFPHESTADQLFSETQFEAYRKLGEHIGDELFGASCLPSELAERYARPGHDFDLPAWIEALHAHLDAR
jgi:hypothetical protein